jgi:uncharacterized ferritin-like protein (DUF455 family)
VTSAVTELPARNLFELAQACINAADPAEKVCLTRAAVAALQRGEISLDTAPVPRPIGEPGRPSRPIHVDPAAVPRRKLGSAEGRAAFLHALAHIEFNAINLAWDAVYRFRDLPRQYYLDWARVADEEAVHFQLLRDRLGELGYDYGAFAAHNGLWETARKTAHDVLVRMALVPRVLEARGLDVTPGMIRRLRQAGDARSAEILDMILRDEIGHVAIGSHWFSYFCAQRAWDQESTFERLVREYVTGRGPRDIDRTLRAAAGFSEREMTFIESGLND